MTRHLLPSSFVCLLVVLSGCHGSSNAPEAAQQAGFQPIDASSAVFWDRQTTETGALIRSLADEFNAKRPGTLPIKIEHTGGYSDIFRKVSASIQARALPAMAVAYQNMTAEYAQANAVTDVESFSKDPTSGLSQAELDDFYPVVFETNRYPDFGNKMLSFPFCKSVLMLYFNKKVLSDAGFATPPATWDAFIEQCRQIKAKTGKPAYAVSVDCSTIAGMIFSLGGQMNEGRKTLFDSPASVRTFEIIETLAKENLGYQITPGTYDDETALAQDAVAFSIRSSSGRTNVGMLMQNAQDRWGMACIPQGDPANPHTVLFGPNICIFNTSPEQQRAAWDFVKFFTSREICVRWALGTGYLPIRKSSVDNPELQKFWGEWPYNRAAFDCLPFAQSEPNAAGWQEVRALVEKAETEVLSGLKTGRDAALELKQKADAVLAKQ